MKAAGCDAYVFFVHSFGVNFLMVTVQFKLKAL